MDFTALKTAIQNAVKLNGNEEITGDILQGVLLSMVSTLGDSAINDLVTAISNEATARQNGDSTLNGYITALQGTVNSINTKLAEGYVYVGIATSSTNPNTPSGKVFYIAVAAGTYTNFLDSGSAALVLTQGINILKYNDTSWAVEQVWGVDDEPTAGSNNLVKSGGVKANEDLLNSTKVNTASINLINPDEIENGYGLYASNGSKQSDANLCLSGYIPVNGKNIICNGHFNAYWGGAVYDINNEIIRTLSTAQYTYQSGDYYIRLTFRLSETQKRANYGTTLAAYVAYNPIDDYISGIKSAVSDLQTQGSGYNKQLGNITNTYSVNSGNNRINWAVNAGETVEIKRKYAMGELGVYFQNASFETLQRVILKDGEYSKVITISDNSATEMVYSEEGNSVTLSILGIEQKIENQKEDIQKVEQIDNIVPHFYKEREDITGLLEFTEGSCGLDGYINTGSSATNTYAYTNRIPVSRGDIIKTAISTSPLRIITAYKGNTAVSASGVENLDSVHEYVVPAGIDGLVITIYKAVSHTANTIIIKHTVFKDNRREENARKLSHGNALRRPMVTIIDDDGNVEFYQYLLPMMRQYNIPMVSAYMGDVNPDMESNALLMTKEQCKEVVEAGGEIIVHTGQIIPDISLSRFERIALLSKEVLKRNGFDSRIFVYSDGVSDPEIRAMISKHFDCAFASSYPRVSNTERSNINCIPQYFIHRENAGGLYYDSQSTTFEYFKDLVDECIAANGWLVLVLHSWMMPEGKRQEGYENIDQFGLLEDVIEYIQSQNVDIVTASEGLEVFGNIYQSGDYMGHWNEEYIPVETYPHMRGHFVPGCAINKVGQWDFPDSGRIIHT